MGPAALTDVVTIERPAQHAVAAQAAIDSCNMVLGQGHCHAAPALELRTTWYAIVVWDTDKPLRARVEVRRRHRNGPLLVAREVEFAVNDALEQRYRALGLLIVSHVVAEASQQRHVAPVVEVPEAGVDAFVDFGLDVLALVGNGVQPKLPRFGLALRPWLAPFGQAFRGFIGAAFATHAGYVEVEWIDATVGLGLMLDSGEPLLVELRVGALVEHVRMHTSDVNLGTDSGAVTRWGGQVGIEGGWVMSDTLTVLLGLEAALMNPPYTLDVGGVRVGEQLAPNWSAVFGMRFDP